MKISGLFPGILLLLSACTCMEPSKHKATITLFKNILQHFSTNSTQDLLPLLQQPDQSLTMQTEVFDKHSNGYAVGIDSMQHFRTNTVEDVFTITYFNTHYSGQERMKELRWMTQSRYSIADGIIKFDSGNAYDISLVDLQEILGKFQQELIPRKASSLCTFTYTNGATNSRATVAVDCFLPCSLKEGNTINYIQIMFYE